LALSRRIANQVEKISTHPNEILKSDNDRLKALELKENEVYPEALKNRIQANYVTLLRGKTLIAILMRHLSYAGRPVHHNHRSLFELVANRRGPLLNRMLSEVEQAFV
jgi:hypothetical protein